MPPVHQRRGFAVHQELRGQITGPYKTLGGWRRWCFERGTKGGDADPKKTLQLRFEHGHEAPLMRRAPEISGLCVMICGSHWISCVGKNTFFLFEFIAIGKQKSVKVFEFLQISFGGRFIPCPPKRLINFDRWRPTGWSLNQALDLEFDGPRK